MHIHLSVPIVLLICSQAVNKDGSEPCTPPDPNPIYGLYIGQLFNPYFCEALTLRRTKVMNSKPDVFCVDNKLFRIIDGPLDATEFTSRYTQCVMKKVCLEDSEQKLGLPSRWMRLTCAEGHLYFNKNPTFVDQKQMEYLLSANPIV